VKNQLHVFVAHDRSHPWYERIVAPVLYEMGLGKPNSKKKQIKSLYTQPQGRGKHWKRKENIIYLKRLMVPTKGWF
jgi:hypothetical protein